MTTEPPHRIRWLSRTATVVVFLILTAVTVWTIVGAVRSQGSAKHNQDAQLAESAHRSTTSVHPVPKNCPPTADACVDTRLRISWLQHDGHITYGPVPVMPGAPGVPGSEPTPQGVFQVEWKDANHVSDEFNEQMPNAVFFAPGGVAFHEGPLSASSHGCVHLSWQDSRYYFDHLPVGSHVAVFGGLPPAS